MPRNTRAVVTEEARRVAALMRPDDDTTPTPDDTPTEPVVALVRPQPRNEREQKHADLLEIVRGAEILRFDAQTTIQLEGQLDAVSDLLAQARAQEANREHVNPDTLRQLMQHTDRWATHLNSWLLQRGVMAKGAGS